MARGKKIIEGAKEARAVAKGKMPVAHMHHFGWPEWRPIAEAPENGHRFLAWCVMKADEYDEDGLLLRRAVVEQYAVVAYYCFGHIVEFPWNGSVTSNVKFTHFMPLPPPPKDT